MSYPRDESAKWGQAASQATNKYEQAKDEILSQDAARGFPAPSGDALTAILTAGQEIKGKLTELNGKIYEEQQGIIFQIMEFELKIAVQVAKLAMQAYKETILNQVAIEQAQAEAKAERGRADVERLNAETEARQAAIIQGKAAIEHEINTYKQQLIDAEYISLGAETRLIQAQLETAEAKLAIIDSIYQVLAAEELVLAAERRRAASLEIVLEAHTRIAAIKKETIPFHQDKAKAREALALATTKEAEVKKALEELGYDRLELKAAQEEADHQVREAELDFEMAKEGLIRATTAVEIARTQSRRLLQEYVNKVRTEVMNSKKLLDKEQIDYKLQYARDKKLVDLDTDMTFMDQDLTFLREEVLKQLLNMGIAATDNAATVMTGATQVYRTDTTTLQSRRIRKGAI